MTTHKTSSKIRNFFKKLGPGLITGASDDDPSGIATYSQAGAQFGLSTLWTALFTFPLMTVIQEMCARIGKVTCKGLASNIKEQYPRPLLYFIALLTVPAIILNISADIAGMGAVSHLVIPQVPAAIFSILFTILLAIGMVFCSYQKIVAVLKYLCLSLFLYLIIPFLVNPNAWQVIKHTLIPHIQFNKQYLGILVAILGTTISPYLFFWQATMEAEESSKKQSSLITRSSLTAMTGDVSFGMLSSNLVMYFIILTTGTVLYKAGINDIQTVEQAAKALEPLAGELSYFLFALGIIGTGLLAIPVLSGCLSYMLTTLFDLKNGLDSSFSSAKEFYLIIIVSLIIALLINFTGFNPIKALLMTAILYGLTAPVLILIILHIANNKKIMGKFTNGWLSNLIGIVAFLLMSAAALLLLYLEFFNL
ncbi:Divalent metal cation transporter MntH [Legionella quinlivanii]|uniref:Divalent metal cation transporter MntH n=1 Tax=Legionella quinlivanii TaxID=45073 RepID=A0A0W0Y5V5_9GAMM|nr:divalent metal cation transporter [Legionella quinlivanii]KTD52197.1 Divalent metal cation transporter MntH [Legionella quinlivanii]SEF75967.1 NRAMP (natural resistance-associated macrophage protein) metal ion transporters [Legionella quinlivanii DSM 21216]STY12304.1 Manganese transport protein MntH [Legionella quinlivanii]